jgi:Uma2 family endonuclease
MAMPLPLYYTRAMLRDLPDDGNRYEVVRGELLVTPAPRPWHEVVTQRLREAVTLYVRRHAPELYVFGSRSEVSWGDDDTEIQPDLFVLPLEQVRTLDYEQMRDLRLVVEGLSPSSRRHDRFTKRTEYQRRGVPLYWIIDPDEHVVEVWHPGDRFPVFERERLEWCPAPDAQPFVLDLATLFHPL